MAITPMDETLAHQTPDTFDRVSTSDRNFYDRYYFNMHSKAGDLFLVFGLGQYPNLGTTDAFACLVYGGKQYVVRCSRELQNDRMNTTIGPFGTEIVKPLQSMRIWCEKNEHGLAFDLVFEGTGPALEEPRQLIRKGPRITMDTSRYTQMGAWNGSLTIKGETIAIAADTHIGVRDHSWGVRSVGEREPMGIQINEYMTKYGFFHMWAPAQFDDFQIKIFIEENADGSNIVEESIKIDTHEKGGAVHQLTQPQHKIRYRSGTRELESAELNYLDENGKAVTMTCTPQIVAYLAAGTGYYPNEEWVHGQYHGPFKLEGVEFDLAERDSMGPLYETIVKFELSTGEVGYGMFENMSMGHHDPYGFDSFEAVAD